MSGLLRLLEESVVDWIAGEMGGPHLNWIYKSLGMCFPTYSSCHFLYLKGVVLNLKQRNVHENIYSAIVQKLYSYGKIVLSKMLL